MLGQPRNDGFGVVPIQVLFTAWASKVATGRKIERARSDHAAVLVKLVPDHAALAFLGANQRGGDKAASVQLQALWTGWASVAATARKIECLQLDHATLLDKSLSQWCDGFGTVQLKTLWSAFASEAAATELVSELQVANKCVTQKCARFEAEVQKLRETSEGHRHRLIYSFISQDKSTV